MATTIVSGDLDMLQLVTDLTHVMTTRGGVQQTVTYEPATVFERYGLTPAQMIDFKALKGDTTDNVPGIPGVGEKTAAKLLQDYGDLDAVYADPDRVQPEKLRLKLLEHRDQVMASRSLVTIHRDLPVTLDLSGAAPRRLRPGGGHAAVPRVRVPLARRAPAAAARRGAPCAGRPAARGGRGRGRARRRGARPFAVHPRGRGAGCS